MKNKNNLFGALIALLMITSIVVGSCNDVMEAKRILPPANSGDKDSPFGIQDLPQYDQDMADLGAVWARISGATGLVWDADEPERGRYDFRRTDSIINSFSEQNIHLLVTILCFNRWDQELQRGETGALKYGLPNNISSYTDYLKTAVKRYPQVDYYQIENEPANVWSGTPEEFATLIKVSSLAIKEANPQAKIVLAGAASPESFLKFYVPMLKELKRLKDVSDEQYIDIADMHWSGQFEYRDKSQGNYRTETFPSAVYDLKTVIEDMQREFKDANFSNLPIWITEMSDYSGQPGELNYLYQSEQEQAIEVLKRHVYSLSIGVKKVFWVGIQEHHNWGNLGTNNYWDNTGLVNNPQNDGRSHQKLSYYTYKKMVEMLKHSDWDDIDVIQESDNVYIYKFIKNGTPIYIAWNDNNEAITMSIPLEKGRQYAKITKAVPQYVSGKEITDYGSAFETMMTPVDGGRVHLVLDKVPVFVEVGTLPKAFRHPKLGFVDAFVMYKQLET